jgi:hypothetical protein
LKHSSGEAFHRKGRNIQNFVKHTDEQIQKYVNVCIIH